MQSAVLRKNFKLREEFEVVKVRLVEETHQHDLEALHARSLLEESELLKLQLVDQKRLYARKMELQQIGIMKVQEKLYKATERQHLEKQCKGKLCEEIANCNSNLKLSSSDLQKKRFKQTLQRCMRDRRLRKVHC